MMRVLLVDDEDLARDRLRRMLGAFSQLAIVGEARDGEEAIEKVVELRPHVVFLDVEMPGCGGLEVVRSLGLPRPKIVFCTGYDQYAVDAFELHAADYLLKPVTRARLARSVEHLQRTSAAEWDMAVQGVAEARARTASRFLVRSGSRYRVVSERDVEYFTSEQGLTALHSTSGRFWMDPTLNALERQLDGGQFFRISRAAIIRLDAVHEIATLVGGYGEVQLRGGARLRVSRRRFQELLGRVAAPGGEPRS